MAEESKKGTMIPVFIPHRMEDIISSHVDAMTELLSQMLLRISTQSEDQGADVKVTTVLHQLALERLVKYGNHVINASLSDTEKELLKLMQEEEEKQFQKNKDFLLVDDDGSEGSGSSGSTLH